MEDIRRMWKARESHMELIVYLKGDQDGGFHRPFGGVNPYHVLPILFHKDVGGTMEE